MGIRNLNSFLRDNASSAIKFTSLSELAGKKIAVDISIYLYKFASDGNLIENIYLMLSVFRHYNIIPIFIFDGKPPCEKRELLIKRREDKREAEEEYYRLKTLLENNQNMDEADRQDIISNMDNLKRKFVCVSRSDAEAVKGLIRAFGATYCDAPGEADELCAILAVKGRVWACLSEDMDMFVYGCPRVIRYLSLLNHTAVLYDTRRILEILEVTQTELREICILSGTDYNRVNDDSKNAPTLYETLKHFKKYRKAKTDLGFYDWLIEKTNYIQDYDILKRINSMFDFSRADLNINKFEDIRIANGITNRSEVTDILREDGFIFPVRYKANATCVHAHP
jgi:flap endonuclease-1